MREDNDMTNINMNQLKADRRELEEQIRKVKKQLRSCWTKPMANEQYQLINLKLEATELCILRAWLRGRHHLPDVDRCSETAERRLKTYQVEAA
jgi:hypothetical protein